MEDILISVRKQGSGLAASVIRGDDVFLTSDPLPEFGPREAAALRWLLEDSPRLSSEAAKLAALSAEAQLTYFGEQLFEALRQPLKSALEDRALDEVALSIHDPGGLARHWPWEILSRDRSPIVFECRSFTRRAGQGRADCRLRKAPNR